MSEPQRTEPVADSLVYKDRSGQPFVIDPKTYASLGHFEDHYSVIRRKLFKRIADTVSPVIPKFEKISGGHGRSMTEIASSKKVVWGGPLPVDIFGARTVKGTRMGLERGNRRTKGDPESPYGVYGFGLMDDVSIGRVIQVSKFLRENGIPTEKPVAVKKLKELLVKDESGNWVRTPVGKWKGDELEEIRKRPDGLDLKKVRKYFKETDFIALERDVQLDERLEDLERAMHSESLREFIEPVFRWLNVACKTRNSGIVPGTTYPGIFTYTREGILKYFQYFLPIQMGTSLGRLHRLGLKHGYLHYQNWSVAGTIYDLDSVGGKALFPKDPVPTDAKFMVDVKDGLIQFYWYALRDYPGFTVDPLEIRRKAGMVFLKAYFTEKYGPDFHPDRLNEEELNCLRRNNYSLDEVAAVSI